MAVDKQCVIYARFSSSNQREASIDQQESACRSYAARNGLTVLRVYADRALTGRTDQRPQFQQMIRDSSAGDFAIVLVYSLDRFSRDRYDAAVYKHQLKQHGVRVTSATEPITDDPAGILMESVLEGLAQYYSAELAQKIRRGYEDNAKKLIAPGSVPFGYQRTSDGKYAIVPSEAETVREIFRRVAAGEMYADIARDLNDRGIKTSKGAAWNKNSFRAMLQNVRYTGTYLTKYNIVENAIPQIITKEMFYQVQSLLPDRKPVRRRTENGYYTLSGRLFCGSCGKPMTGVSGTSRNGSLCYYYACAGHREHTCSQGNVRRDNLEEQIASALWDDVLSDDCIEWMAHETAARQRKDFPREDMDLVQSELDQVKKEKANVLRAIAAGIFTDGTRDLLLSLERREADLSACISSASSVADKLPTAEDIRSYLELFREGSPEQPFSRQGILDAFVTRVNLYQDHLTVFFKIKKEDRQRDIPFADPLSDSGSFSRTKWRCGELKQTLRGLFKATKWSCKDPKRTVYYIDDYVFALVIKSA